MFGIKKSKYQYNDEAEGLIKTLPKLSLADFEKWIDNQVLLIGSNNVIQYSDEKKRWNTTCHIKHALVRCDFSAQAKTVITQMESFNEDECRIWFSNSLQLTKGDILNYLGQLK